jgi:hypothetical protein
LTYIAAGLYLLVNAEIVAVHGEHVEGAEAVSTAQRK